MAPFFKRDGIYAVVDCSDWDNFRSEMRLTLERSGKSKALSDRFLFRGQSCSSWGLQSSFDRIHEKLPSAERDRKYFELMKLFRESYEVYGGLARSDLDLFDRFEDLTDEQVEALAQHYGINTRLLDWSYSPYVAAFFSLSRVEKCTSGKISIWTLDKDVFKNFSMSEISYIRDFYRGNVRNLWQMGAFTRNKTSTIDMVELFTSVSKSYDHKLDAGDPALSVCPGT